MPVVMPPSFGANNQYAFRVYADNAGLNAATGLAADNTQAQVSMNGVARVRIGVYFDYDWAERIYLQHRINGGAWTTTTGATACRIEDSTQFADGAATTQRITSGTFQAGEGIDSPRNSASGWGAGNVSEWEWNLRFASFNVGDVIEFRVVGTTSASHGATLDPLDTYTIYASVRITAQAVAGGNQRMPFRASVFEAGQIGVETVAGTAVPAIRRLLATEFMPSPKPNVKTFRPQGNKFRTSSIRGKEMTEGSYDGVLAYNDIVYLLSALVQKNPSSVYALVTSNTSSNFRISFGGNQTADIAGNATAATIQTAIAGLTGIGAANVVVWGTAPNFTIALLNALVASPNSLSAQNTAGGMVSFAVTNGFLPNSVGIWNITTTGSAGQAVTLNFNGQATTGLTGASNAAAIQTALGNLSTVGSTNVTVTNTGGNNFTIKFVDALSGTMIPLTASVATGLTGQPATPTITNTRRWLFAPLMAQPDIVQTYTLEKGSSAGGSQSAFMMPTDLTMNFSKDDANISGNFFARTMVEPFTLTTAGVTDVAALPIDPETVTVYAGTSLLGMTRLTACLSAELGFSGRFRPVMTLNDAVASFTDYVELAPELKGNIVTEHNSQALAFLASLRTSQTNFLRIEALGGYTEGSNNRYRVQFTTPVRWLENPRSDEDGVYASTFPFESVYDSSFGDAWVCVVDNIMTGL